MRKGYFKRLAFIGVVIVMIWGIKTYVKNGFSFYRITSISASFSSEDRFYFDEAAKLSRQFLFLEEGEELDIFDSVLSGGLNLSFSSDNRFMLTFEGFTEYEIALSESVPDSGEFFFSVGRYFPVGSNLFLMQSNPEDSDFEFFGFFTIVNFRRDIDVTVEEETFRFQRMRTLDD